MKETVAKMHKLQRQRELLEKECDLLGQELFGKSYICCGLEETTGVLTIYDNAGHEFDPDEYYYGVLGDEILD